jgi:hypothetical protein
MLKIEMNPGNFMDPEVYKFMESPKHVAYDYKNKVLNYFYVDDVGTLKFEVIDQEAIDFLIQAYQYHLLHSIDGEFRRKFWTQFWEFKDEFIDEKLNLY